MDTLKEDENLRAQMQQCRLLEGKRSASEERDISSAKEEANRAREEAERRLGTNLPPPWLLSGGQTEHPATRAAI